MRKLLSYKPLWQDAGLALIRIIVGCFLIYHGKELLDAAKMKEYAGWGTFKGMDFMPYIGKGAELVAGVLFVAGLLTWFASLLVIGTFVYIVFFVGHGKIWYEDQYPLLFALLGGVFFFTGPGKISLDAYLFKK